MADTRVCPSCGEAAGDRPFCAGCGANLTQLSRLPSQVEWEEARRQEQERLQTEKAAREEQERRAALEAAKVERRVCGNCFALMDPMGLCPACGELAPRHVRLSDPTDAAEREAAVQAQRAEPEAAPVAARKVSPVQLAVAGAIAVLVIIGIANTVGGSSESVSPDCRGIQCLEGLDLGGAETVADQWGQLEDALETAVPTREAEREWTCREAEGADPTDTADDNSDFFCGTYVSSVQLMTGDYDDMIIVTVVDARVDDVSAED